MAILKVLKTAIELWRLIGDDLIEIHNKLIDAIKEERAKEALEKKKKD